MSFLRRYTQKESMKNLFFGLLFFIGAVNVLNSQILASKNGYNYTQADFQKAVRFTEFLCDKQLTDSELAMLKESELADFNADPQTALQNLNNIEAQMQQIYNTADPLQVGMSRSIMIANIYYSIQQMSDDNKIKQIFNNNVLVLAIDPYNGVSLTEKDVEAYFDYLTFYSGLTGQTVVYDRQTRDAYRQTVIDMFLYGDNQTKAMLAVMDTYNKYMQSAYNSLTPQQKQQFAASMTQNYNNYEQNYSYDNSSYGNTSTSSPDFSKNDAATNQMYFNVMQDYMMQSHATSLNIIENMGNTGNYWEVVDSPY